MVLIVVVLWYPIDRMVSWSSWWFILYNCQWLNVMSWTLLVAFAKQMLTIQNHQVKRKNLRPTNYSFAKRCSFVGSMNVIELSIQKYMRARQFGNQASSNRQETNVKQQQQLQFLWLVEENSSQSTWQSTRVDVSLSNAKCLWIMHAAACIQGHRCK